VRIWRVSNHANLAGLGGLRAAGRWHTAGQPIVYCAHSPAAALLEILAHQYLSVAGAPERYQYLEIEVPDDVVPERLPESELPVDWRNDLSITRSYGTGWLLSQASALLEVPSVPAPLSYNVLINPAHPDAAKLQIVSVRQVPLDPRLRGRLGK
jgi:RES domain-containing protein